MKKILILVLVIAIILAMPINAAPGDNSDPIVVLSYLNQRINELISKYNLDKISEHEKTIAELKEKIKSGNTGGSTGGSALEVVNLKVGEKLIAGAGTEIILRGGKATAIASSLGGLSDVTKAVDIAHGADIAPNHLLIVPRNDGRGVLATTEAILMVRGEYKVVSN